MSLKVLVRDETIAVNVEISEDFEGTRLTLAVRYILNFRKNSTHATGCCIVSDVTFCSVLQFLINEGRRRVGACTSGQIDCQLVRVFLKDEWCNGADISRTVRTVLEGRKETFEVTLRESSLQDFLVARFINESLHLIDRDVTVLVSVYLFT